MGKMAGPNQTSYLNPGYKSQYSGFQGSASNLLGRMGNEFAYDTSMKQRVYDTPNNLEEQLRSNFGKNKIQNNVAIPPSQAPVNPSAPPAGYMPARATAYNGLDDQYGATTAKPNPTGEFKAIEGATIAVDPNLIPYGSKVQVVNAKGQPVILGSNTDGIYYAHDTGGAVKSKKASKGLKPVIDFYSANPDPNKVNEMIGQEIFYKILGDS